MGCNTKTEERKTRIEGKKKKMETILPYFTFLPRASLVPTTILKGME